MAKNIMTYQDLIETKKHLKQDIDLIEEDIKDTNIVKISNLLIAGKPFKTPNLESLHVPHIKDVISSPLANFASTLLLSNKKIRKYFIAFVIVRETVPYAVTQIKKIIDEYKEY